MSFPSCSVIQRPILSRSVNLVFNLYFQQLNKEAAWTLSNITAGTVNQIDRVLEMDLMGEVINVLSHGEFTAKKEATWAVTNLTSGGKPHQMKAIIELGVLEPLARMLTCNDIKIVQV